jgi:hypothetical protein
MEIVVKKVVDGERRRTGSATWRAIDDRRADADRARDGA